MPAHTRSTESWLRSAATRTVGGSLAPFLVLVTPFVTFVHYQHYGLSHPEVVIVLLVFAATALVLGVGAERWAVFEVVVLAALLTWFADIQLEEPGAKRLLLLFLLLCAVLWALREHAARIVSLMMATMLAVSLLPAGAQAVASPQMAAGRPGLPLIVHFVLDEHIGIEGLPAELTPPAFKRDTQSFFIDRGFRLFGSAYSEHPATRPSVSHLLNLVSGEFVHGLTTDGSGANTFRLTRNAYFERFQQAGYSIHVHQPDYLDVCAGRLAPPACHTYAATSLHALDALHVSTPEKLSVVGGMYLTRSEAVDRIKRVYHRGEKAFLAVGVRLPAWNWERNVVAPVATMQVLDQVSADLAAAQPGELVYAHLLLPHYPYVYTAGCEARPPSQWLKRGEGSDHGFTNTPRGRATRYANYFQQVRCAQRQIARLLDAIPAPLRHDAIVIVQGDHGSRIGLTDPGSHSGRSFTKADYTDHFSTLFAVRSPQLEAGYDPRVAPITCLLRTLVKSDFRSIDGLGACSSSDVVFFQDETRHTFPGFSHPAERAVGLDPAAR